MIINSNTTKRGEEMGIDLSKLNQVFMLILERVNPELHQRFRQWFDFVEQMEIPREDKEQIKFCIGGMGMLALYDYYVRNKEKE